MHFTDTRIFRVSVFFMQGYSPPQENSSTKIHSLSLFFC